MMITEDITSHKNLIDFNQTTVILNARLLCIRPFNLGNATERKRKTTCSGAFDVFRIPCCDIDLKDVKAVFE
jgi:hypothetical protein